MTVEGFTMLTTTLELRHGSGLPWSLCGTLSSGNHNEINSRELCSSSTSDTSIRCVRSPNELSVYTAVWWNVFGFSVVIFLGSYNCRKCCFYSVSHRNRLNQESAAKNNDDVQSASIQCSLMQYFTSITTLNSICDQHYASRTAKAIL